MLLALLIACSGASAPETSPPPQPPQSLSSADMENEALLAVDAAAKAFGSQLKGKLIGAMKAEGPVAAVNVCNADASGIAEAVATEHGVTVGRSSLRLRNHANQDAPQWVRDWLQKQGERKADGAEGIRQVVHDDTTFEARLLVPLAVEAPCVTCHGETIAEPVAEVLAQHYPDDKATGYAVGDLRGALWVTKPLKAE